MRYSKYILFCFSLLLLIACASIGSPDGGRYDEEPPVVVSASPANKATGVKSRKATINFNEYIKLDNPNEKVIVSPPQTEAPNIRVVGKSIRIDLYDSLQANTTYTVDFSDAIQDNNEGNPMGLYTYSFSTGDRIDTMEVSGTVLNAQDLEPIKGIMVGLYRCDSILADSTFRTQALQRVARTNGSGRFTIKGVAPGKYRAFALKDMDGNFRFSQKSEQLAFDTVPFSTSSRPDLRPDTVWTDTSHIEKIRMVPYIHYYPDNLTLLAFLEDGQDQHLLKTERLKPEMFTLYFTAPADTLPLIQGFNFDASALVPEPSLHNDTINYWIPDTLVAWQDTLHFSLTYLETDTLGRLVSRTDTLEMVPKQTHAKLEKERQKKIEEWMKSREKKQKRSKEPLPPEENPYEVEFLEVQVKPSGTMDPNQNVTFTFSQPIAAFDTASVHFYEKVDTLYEERPYLLVPDSVNRRRYTLYAEWEPKSTYQLLIDSMAFRGVLGNPSQQIKTDLRIRSLDEFGTIFLKLNNLNLREGEQAIVQLMNKSDKPVFQQVAEKDRVDFFYLKPGEYYLRLIVDRNGNGKWDTGNYDAGLQAEEVFYFPQPIAVKAKWEMEQAWDVRGIERDKQKPMAITKQKPDKKKDIKDRNRKREEEMRNNGMRRK